MKKVTVEPWEGFHGGVVPTTAKEVIEKITAFKLSKALEDQRLVLDPTSDVSRTIEYIFTVHKGKNRKAVDATGGSIPYIHHALRTAYFVSRVRDNDPSAVIPALLIGVVNESRTNSNQRHELISFVETLQAKSKILPVVSYLLDANAKMSGGGKLDAITKLWKKNLSAFVVKTVSCLEHLDADLMAITFFGNRGTYLKKRNFKTSVADIKKFHRTLIDFMEDLQPNVKTDTNVAMIVGQYRAVFAEFAPETKKEVEEKQTLAEV
jgi:hypothetical protein